MPPRTPPRETHREELEPLHDRQATPVGASNRQIGRLALHAPLAAHVRLPSASTGLRALAFTRVHGALLEQPHSKWLRDLHEEVVRLDQEARDQEDANLILVLDQFLRHCYLADISFAWIISPTLPPLSLASIRRFSARTSWVGTLRPPFDIAGFGAHDSWAERLAHQADAFASSSDVEIGFVLSPGREELFDPSPSGDTSAPLAVRGHRAPLAPISLMSSATRGADTSPVGRQSLGFVAWPSESPLEAGIVAVSQEWTHAGSDATQRALVLYRALDEPALDLVAELRGLAQGHADPRLAAHQLEDRFSARLEPGSRAGALLEIAAAQLATGRRLDRLTANPVILPESVRTPEEVDYHSLNALKLALQDARRIAETSGAPSDVQAALNACWADTESAAASLAPDVRASDRRLEHRLGQMRSQASTIGAHCIFYATLTTYNADDQAAVVRCLERQASMLKVMNTLAYRSPAPSQIELTYRLFTTQTSSGDLEATFEIEGTGLNCTPEDAEMLKETFGELIHTTFLGVYGLSFGYTAPPNMAAATRLLRPTYATHIVRTLGESGYLPFAGRPDWGHVLDYVRSLERPVVLEMRATPGGYSASALPRPAEDEPQYVGASNKPDADSVTFAKVLTSLRGAPDLVQVTITIGSNEPLSPPLVSFLAAEISGGGPFESMEPSTALPDAPDRNRLALHEALGFFHPPMGKTFGSSSRERQPIPTPLGSFPLSGLHLGWARKVHAKANRDISVTIPETDLLRHVHVIGRTGSGKTNLLRGMVSQMLESPSVGLAVIDPHGDLSSHVLNSVPTARIDDVRVVDLSNPELVPVLNPLIMSNPGGLERALVVQDVLELLRLRVFHQFTGPRFDELVRLVIETMLDSGYQATPSLVDIPLLLTNKERQRAVRARLDDAELGERWKFNDGLAQTRDYLDVVDWVVSKLDDIARDETLRAVLGGERNTVDLDEIVRTNGLLVVALPEAAVGRQTASFVGSLVLQSLRRALLLRPTGDSAGPNFYLCVDEFQRFATSGFEDLVAEARKYGVGLVMAHQNLEQVSGFSAHTGGRSDGLLQAVLGNVGSTIAFGVGASDIATVARQLNVEEAAVAHVPKHHALVRLSVNDASLETFTLRTNLHEARLDPRMQDAIFTHLVDHGLLARRADVLQDVEDRWKSLASAAEEHKGAATRRRPTRDTQPTPQKHDEPLFKRWLQARADHRRGVSAPAGPKRRPRRAGGDALSGAARRTPAVTGTAQKATRSTMRPAAVRSSATARAIASPATTALVGKPSGRAARNWGEIVGAVTTLDRLAKEWNQAPALLRGRAARNELLLLTTREGTEVVPVSHLDGATLLAGLPEVLERALAGRWQSWTVAGWLATPNRRLGGDSPLGWLRDEKPLPLLLAVADWLAAER